MLVAESGSQIRVGALFGGTSAGPGATGARAGYAGDWNPASGSGASVSSAASRWPTPSAAPTPQPSAAPSPRAGARPGPTPSPSPGPVPQAPHVLTPAEMAAQKAAARHELQTAKIDATLAQDVYNDPPNPPAGYRVADDAQLSRLGLTPAMLDDGRSDFKARVYVGDDGRTVVAYRGSQSREDWRNDLQQGSGAHSDYYDRAIDIGQRVARSGEAVTFTGHSLGGGLASASAVASGREADTFNAAGLTGATLSQARAADRAAGGRGAGAHVDAYYDGGDPLSRLQDANALEGAGVGGGLLGGVFGPIGAGAGIVLGGLVGHAPSAYGTRHVLDTIDPPGGGSVLDRHGMDYVQRGLDRALAGLH